MEILPSIDLRGGRVVRLAQGDYERQTVYGDDAVSVARQFVSAGARWIHMVDLDAARTGRRTNAAAIAGVCEEVQASVELGGGIRDDAAAREALELGVARVIVGSAAVERWDWFAALAGRGDMAGKVVLGIDARSGQVAAHGWTEQADLTVSKLAARARDLPLAAIIYTDIERDGMLAGPDLETTAQLIADTELPVIASGGVACLDDVARCRDIGCAGVIIGRAYYEGRIDLADACEIAGA